MTMNICGELRCPHALKSGCDRFSVSNHCPLLLVSPEIRPNQYWLFADDNAQIDINELRNTLQVEVLDTERSQEMLHYRTELSKKPIVMAWEK